MNTKLAQNETDWTVDMKAARTRLPRVADCIFMYLHSGLEIQSESNLMLNPCYVATTLNTPPQTKRSSEL